MRVRSIFRNVSFSMLSQIVLLLLGFFSQRVMNVYMGTELVGLNGVISNVISILSVTELGVSTAVVFHLYGALAGNDEKQVISLMSLYRRAYHIFAGIITALGLILLPFIHLFAETERYSLGYTRVLYLLWLLRTVLSYFFTYKKSLLYADQKEYVATIATIGVNVAYYSAIIVFVKFTQRYMPALVCAIVAEFVINAVISRYVDKKYPYLAEHKREKPEKSLIRLIASDLKNVFASKLSLKLLTGSDNVIISAFISVATVGLYSNYMLLINSLTNIIVAINSSLSPTVGNIFAEDDSENKYQVLRQTTFLFYILTAITGVGLITLADRFIADIWLTDRYVLDRNIVILAVATCLVNCIGFPLGSAMAVSGQFRAERNLSLITCIVNIAVSLALVIPLGVSGVIIGTCFSYVIQLIYRMAAFFKDYLKRGAGEYITDMLGYIACFLAELFISVKIIDKVYKGSVISFALCIIICVAVVFAVTVLVYFRSWRFKSLFGLLRMVMPQKRKVGE